MGNRNQIESVRLGLMPPLTGIVAMYGPEIIHAARIACDEINERGGVLGRPLELIIEDDGSLPQTAVPAALKLVDDHHCVALIGNLLSNSRIAVVDQVAEPKHTPLLNFSFYEGSIFSRYFFNFAALPNQQIDRMIPYMATHYGAKMFFAGNNYEWPRGSIDAAKRSLKLIDGDIVGEEYLDIGVELSDIDNLLAHVSRSGADVFVPYFAGTDQMMLLTRFTELGMKNRMAVVMGHYDEAMTSRLPPQVREGFYSSNTYFMSVDTPENQRYLERLKCQPGINGIWPHGNGILTNFGEGAYLCVHAFAKAAEHAGSTDTGPLVEALKTIRVTGPQGEIEMDAGTHHAKVNTYLARCNADGTFTIADRFGRIPPVIPDRYREQATKLHESLLSPMLEARLAAKLAAEVTAVMNKFGATQQILSLADVAILATDEQGIIIESNPNVCHLFGYTSAELLGMSVHLLLPPHFRQRHTELLQQFVASGETLRRMAERREVTGYRKDGTFFPLEAAIAKFRSGDEWGMVVTLRDITDRKLAEEVLVKRSTHDILTGLANRALIQERLEHALQRSRRQGLSVALLFIDLDGFKLINDTHGHDAGDAMLKAAADRMIEVVRPGDTVARLAGDEFIVLCEQLEDPTVIAELAERITHVLRQPVEFLGLQMYVSASIGIAVGHGNTHTVDRLLRSADTAMYAVKVKGRDGWQFFNDLLQEQAHQRLTITQGLRQAIEHNELSPRFQPIVSTETGRILGAELLLRWHPPEGEVSPAVFIPIAEMTGTILSIGTWVFREGCRAEVDWRRRWGENAPYVSVNVSTRQLNEKHLVDDFASIMRETGADPRNILLEITETSLMADVEANLLVLRQLTELGLRVAVDDFGTGYSSLSQLTHLPVSVLKIDRAFVDGIEKQQESRTLIRAVISLGRALGFKLIAEGVENETQLQELREHGCDLCQGFYFHRPLVAHDFIKAMENDIAR